MSFTPASKRRGSSDWAVLCSVKEPSRCSSFSPARRRAAQSWPSAPETERLQAHDPSDVLGFNWGIDPASPEQVHEAQIGMQPSARRASTTTPSPTRIIDHHTIYHFYSRTPGRVIDMPD